MNSQKRTLVFLLNGILALSACTTAGSSIRLTGSAVIPRGDGANGVFATGAGVSVNRSNSTVTDTGQYAHAVMDMQGGSLVLNNVDMTAAGASSGAGCKQRVEPFRITYPAKFSDGAGISSTTMPIIIGNGHTIYDDASANASLGGKTCSLTGGGVLKPIYFRFVKRGDNGY